MNDIPNIKSNPLYISVGLLVISYLIGEFILPKYPLIYFFQLIGMLGLIISTLIFFSSFNLFRTYGENPAPGSTTNQIIKTGIFSYTRNPIYLSFLMFHLSMFLVFENVVYILSSFGMAIWLHHYVIKSEEDFLLKKFSDEYERYKDAVNRWIFF